MTYNKLALFDIDGTLIAHAGALTPALNRYQMAIKATYGIDTIYNLKKYNGSIERAIAWDLLKDSGISRDAFLEKFPMYVEHLRESLMELSQKQPLYVPIPDAVTLAEKLSQKKDTAVGVITGNAKRIAEWKLVYTGLTPYFSFGLYGDEADDRNELAKLVFEKSKKELHQTFAPKDIIVIGDTIHDIRAGKAIGATTIAVTTGLHVAKNVLAHEQPDFLVDTLLDNAILTLFGLVEA